MDFEDQTGRIISIDGFPKRIVSLVPSQTELLCYLGLLDNLVGRTNYCIHPQAVEKIPSAGGTKKQILKRIKSLNPELIIGNKEENTRAMVEAMEADFPVWLSDVRSLKDALQMIKSIGQITDTASKAEALSNQVAKGFDKLSNKFEGNVVYLIWEKPTMGVGQNTFINSIIDHLGFTNLISEARYPKLDLSVIKKRNPDYLWLSSEPFPYAEKHVNEYQKELPDTKVKIVDGEMFSWYGSRLLKSINYFSSFKPG